MDLVVLIIVAVIALGAGFAFGKLGSSQAVSSERTRADQLQGEVNRLSTERDALAQFKTNSDALQQMLQPMREAVQKLNKDAVDSEMRQTRANEALVTQINLMGKQAADIQETNRKIVSALTTSASRGRWGEMQLERLFEYAGMEKNVHYFSQSTGESDAGRGRPDFIVKLANGGTVFIDAKFPFDAYWRALETDNVTDRASLMKEHASAVKARVKELAKRQYQQQADDSADFAVVFLPFESLYYEAIEAEPNLMTDVFAQNVVIATPSSMMALLHTIKLGITQQKSADNAAKIRLAAVELLNRISVFTDHLIDVDKSLSKAVESLAKLKSSYESRLLPQARAMESLGVEAARKRKEVPGIAMSALTDGELEGEELQGEIEA
jgi:DNA recombination protein RmuC